MPNIDIERAKWAVHKAQKDLVEQFPSLNDEALTVNLHPIEEVHQHRIQEILKETTNWLNTLDTHLLLMEETYPAPDGNNLRDDILFFFRRGTTYNVDGYYRSDWSVEQQLKGEWDRKDIIAELEKLEQEGILERQLEGNCDRDEDEYGSYDDSCMHNWKVTENDYDGDTLICPKCESEETHTNWAYRLKMG